MRRKILTVIAFVIMFIVLDRLIAMGISHFAIERQFDTRILSVVKGEINADVLIFGSSRAARNISPSEVEKITDLKTYSLSFPGTNVDFQETVLKLVLDSGNLPKKIVLVLDDPFEIQNHSAITYRYDYLYPYIWFNSVEDILCERGKRNCVMSFVSKSYAENLNVEESLNYLDEGKLKEEPLTKVDLSDGSMLLDFNDKSFGSINYSSKKEVYDKSLESADLYGKLKEFVSLCKENSIDLYVVFPPLYRASTDGFIDRMKEVIGEGPKYFEYQNFIGEKQFFYDVHHLNKRGALLFSKEIARIIVLP